MEQDLATFIDYDELDSLVKEVYGHDWEFCADQEASNDTAYSWRFKKVPLDRWEAARLADFKLRGNGNHVASAIIQDLVNQNKIPEGRLVILVSW